MEASARSLLAMGPALRSIVLVATLLSFGASRADVPDGQRPEVDHLLRFIETSTCSFVRNGRRYDGERAYRHVLRKYAYFRDEISSTEDFVEYAATRSTISGQPYAFVCGGESTDSRTILLAELERFRARASQ